MCDGVEMKPDKFKHKAPKLLNMRTWLPLLGPMVLRGREPRICS
jgi:hypothetical protein